MSVALGTWNGARKAALAEIAAAHGALGGPGPGRRYATLQLNHACAVLLSSQFQGFCRDLHSEAVAFLVANTQPTPVAGILQVVTMQGRKLDHGNPNPSNLGSDFARLGMDFWTKVGQVDRRKPQRSAALKELNDWRNAIAHQDWSGVPNQDPSLQLRQVNAWRFKTGRKAEKIYFAYTTCPRCAKAYGKNYVVLFAKLADVSSASSCERARRT